MTVTPGKGSAPSSHQPAVLVAAAASIAAGLVHAAASGSHAELATLSVLFAVTALAQIGWGASVLVRPTSPVVVAGIGIHLAALGAWFASRTVGIAAIEGLEGSQAVTFQDGLVAGLQVVAVLGAALALTSVALPRIARAAVPAVVAALAFATVPAMAQPHDHGSHDHAAADVAADAHGDDGHGDDGHDAAHDDHHGTDAVAAAADAAEVQGSPDSGCDHDRVGHDAPAAAPTPTPTPPPPPAADHVDPPGTPDHGH